MSVSPHALDTLDPLSRQRGKLPGPRQVPGEGIAGHIRPELGVLSIQLNVASGLDINYLNTVKKCIICCPSDSVD